MISGRSRATSTQVTSSTTRYTINPSCCARSGIAQTHAFRKRAYRVWMVYGTGEGMKRLARLVSRLRDHSKHPNIIGGRNVRHFVSAVYFEGRIGIPGGRDGCPSPRRGCPERELVATQMETFLHPPNLPKVQTLWQPSTR